MLRFVFVCAILSLSFRTTGKTLGQEVIPTIHSPQSEVVAANEFLVGMAQDMYSHIRFFSTYNIPEDDMIVISSENITRQETLKVKDGMVRSLNFWIHSLSYESFVQPVRKVEGDNDLWWIDIRDYGWTPEAWEKISKNEPYFREPWVKYNDYQILRSIAGNAVVRADWFIIHTSDVTKQVDRGLAPLYYELLYAKVGIPKTLDEFRAAWGVDVKKIEKLAIEKGVIVDKGVSGVSRNNRQISRTRTELGYYYETSDVKTSSGKQDYVENLDPFGLSRDDRDAGETFTTNKLGLQVYFLYDDKNNRVEFGDPTVVWDRTDNKDIRVRTARSCVICHANAVNIPVNALSDHLKAGVELLTYSKDYQIALERFYLSPMGELFDSDQKIFNDAVKAVNGMSGLENASLYQQILQWYERSISIGHAAHECGVSLEKFKEKCSGTISGRLGVLVKSEKAINREHWEDLDNGIFAQAMLLINSLKLEQVKIAQQTPQIDPLSIKILRNMEMKKGNVVVTKLAQDDIIMLESLDPNANNLYMAVVNGQRVLLKRSDFEFVRGKPSD